MQKPPYKISKKALNQISEISKLIGKLEGLHLISSNPQLRKKNRIKTIHGSLTIEGNDLGIEKISDIVENKKVFGPQKEIIEVKNAIRLYQEIKKFNFKKEKSFLKAHQILMKNLINNNGVYRKKNVGILKGSHVSHVAPQPKMLNTLMSNLFDYLENYDEHLLIKSSVFHYELEFIHPFSDGNGRIGRFWQSLILTSFDPIFEHIPIESIIFKEQKKYYQVLETCDKDADSTKFIEFMLKSITTALESVLSESKPINLDSKERIEIAQQELKNTGFSRKDYMSLFKNISTATANRDLKLAVEKKVFKKTGDKRNTSYTIT